MGAVVAVPEMAAGDVVGEVLQGFLAEVLATPWLVGLLVLLAIGKVVQLGRAILHGGHERDLAAPSPGPRRPKSSSGQVTGVSATPGCSVGAGRARRSRPTTSTRTAVAGRPTSPMAKRCAGGTTSRSPTACRGLGSSIGWLAAGRATSLPGRRPRWRGTERRPISLSRSDVGTGSARQRRPLEHLLAVPQDVPLRR